MHFDVSLMSLVWKMTLIDTHRSSNAIVNLLGDILHSFENVVCVPSSILAAYATVFFIIFIEIDLEIIALPLAAILTSEMFFLLRNFKCFSSFQYMENSCFIREMSWTRMEIGLIHLIALLLLRSNAMNSLTNRPKDKRRYLVTISKLSDVIFQVYRPSSATLSFSLIC